MAYVRRMNVDDVAPIFSYLKEEGVLNVFFYDGSITEFEEFNVWAHDPSKTILLLYDEGELLGLGVACHLTSRALTAMVHVCIFEHGRQNIDITKLCAEKAFKYYYDAGVRTVVGLTPSVYRYAVKFIKELGMVEVARIPNAAELVYHKGRHCDLVLTMRQLEF